jgi:hypothetical protein
MSILDNEGHDPQGLGNTPSRSELSRLRAENERLRDELRFAKSEFQCLRNWMDRAQASLYRYRDDPALPGHREAADKAAERMGAALATEQKGQQ